MEPELACLARTPIVNTDFTKCVICQRINDQHLGSLTEKGIASFILAMNNRKDDVHDRLSALMHDPCDFLRQKPKYHRSCRSEYIHKKDMRKLTEKRPVTISIVDPENVPSKKRCLTKPDLRACCFICLKQRDPKGRWELTKVSSIERQTSIHKKAKEVKDEHLLTLIEGHGESHVDMIAKQFKYHKHCMNSLMLRQRTQYEIKPSTSQTDDKDAYDIAFRELVSEIEIPLMKKQSVYFLGQLRNRLRQLLEQMDVNSIYNSSRTKRRLLNHFGQSIQIISQRGQRAIVCSGDITVSDMCRLASKLKTQVQDSEFQSSDSDSDHYNDSKDTQHTYSSDTYAVAKHVRNAIKDKETHHKLDEGELELSYEKASDLIPDALYNLIALIITNNKDEEITALGRVQVTNTVHEKVLNISQDIMARVTHIPMPKNTGLALHVLRQTRSSDLIQILNRFGHSISYDDAQRYVTSMAEKVELQIIDHGIFIPTSLREEAFTHCAFDNLDFHEDTKDGSTLHAISHNIYQYEQNTLTDAAVLPAKARARTIATKLDFATPDSGVNLSTRKKARSLTNVDLSNVFASNNYNVNLLNDDTFIWALLRQECCSIDGNFTTSRPLSWNEYFEQQMKYKQDKTIIAYGPLFPQSPTDPDAVQASLDYFIQLTGRMGQDSTVITCDQAIYDIVRGIMHKSPGRYGRLVVRLGGFHIAENFLGAIGFAMRGSGIEDILVACGVCLRGTANKVISGKDYYKMVRCHSLVCESMIGLLWNSFKEWLEHNAQGQLNMLTMIVHLNSLQHAFGKNTVETVVNQLDQLKCDLSEMQPVWQDFLEQLSVTGKYWLTYIEMVLILKRYIWAERAGDWNCHLVQVREMLPYLISARHSKYASCVPLYLTDMYKLQETHPYVHDNFLRGHFAVHKTSGKFNGVWSDLALEQTYNKEGKTSLLKGVSQKPATRDKYIHTAPYMTHISESVKVMAHVEEQGSSHHGNSSKATAEDLAVVENMQDLIRKTMLDPFNAATNREELFNISTGEKCASAELLRIKQVGLDALVKADTNNLEKVIIPKIQTFVGKSTIKTTSTALTKIYQDETAVTRALCFTQYADEETRNDAFSHEWTNYPSSLFKPADDNSSHYVMRTGSKADFLAAILAKIEEDTQMDVLPNSDQPTAYIIDMMAFVQRCQKLSAKFFADLAFQYLQFILRICPNGCKQIHIVGDRYDFNKSESLKAAERDRRSGGKRSKEYIIADAVEIPDWKEFMGNEKNKFNLLNYISEHICEHHAMIPGGITVILGGTFRERGKCVSIQNGVKTVISALACTQHEEADTRIIAHLAYCLNVSGIRRAVISCTDTDIILLSMYHYSLMEMDELWIQKGVTYLAIHQIVGRLLIQYGNDAFEITHTLLSAYVLSGCDTTSYPYRRGKRHAALVALSVIGSLSGIGNFGNDDEISVPETIIDEARLFFIKLYGKEKFQSLDLLRQHLFATSNSDLRLLPPTEDSFKYHALRCLYQLLIYHRAHLSDLRLPPPTEFGRKLDDQKLVPIIGTKTSKPNKVKAISCKCKSSKCLRNCSCAKSGMKCFIGCICLGSSETCGRVNLQNNTDSD